MQLIPNGKHPNCLVSVASTLKDWEVYNYILNQRSDTSRCALKRSKKEAI